MKRCDKNLDAAFKSIANRSGSKKEMALVAARSQRIANAFHRDIVLRQRATANKLAGRRFKG